MATTDQNTCQDSLAINYGEAGECQYAGMDPEGEITTDASSESSGCGCGKNKSNGGLFSGNKSKWIWIIIGTIVVYYLYKKFKK